MAEEGIFLRFLKKSVNFSESRGVSAARVAKSQQKRRRSETTTANILKFLRRALLRSGSRQKKAQFPAFKGLGRRKVQDFTSTSQRFGEFRKKNR